MSRQEHVLVKRIHELSAVLLASRGHAETYLARIQFCDALEALRDWAEAAARTEEPR